MLGGFGVGAERAGERVVRFPAPARRRLDGVDQRERTGQLLDGAFVLVIRGQQLAVAEAPGGVVGLGLDGELPFFQRLSLRDPRS